MFVAGPLALVIAWAIITNNKYRHPLQLIICVAEIYGGWMTFGPGTYPDCLPHAHLKSYKRCSNENEKSEGAWRQILFTPAIPLFRISIIPFRFIANRSFSLFVLCAFLFHHLEWVSGSVNINASTFTYMWLYLTIPNGAWVAIPGWLAWESVKAFTDALDSGKKKRASSTRARSTTTVESPVASPTATRKSPAAPRSPRGPRTKKTE